MLAPDSAVALEALIGGEGTTLDVTRFHPADGRPSSFAAVYQALLERGAVPVGVARGEGRPDIAPVADTSVNPGDELLVARRREPATTAPPRAAWSR